MISKQVTPVLIDGSDVASDGSGKAAVGPDHMDSDKLIDGIAVIDKPAGWSSHDVVVKSRNVLGKRKVGHGGTLDPDATGVLVLGVGRATRLLRFVSMLPKSYEAEIVFGVQTDTLDASGTVVARHDMTDLTEARVRSAAAELTGNIMQKPPMVSAVKVAGRRLYELARAGVEIDRTARPVTVTRFDLEPVAERPGVWHASIECSSGTYVRVLASDLGYSLGGSAHLGSLRRMAIGHFTLEDASSPESPKLMPMACAVSGLPGVRVSPDVATEVGNGRVLSLDYLGIVDGMDISKVSSGDSNGSFEEPVPTNFGDEGRTGPWAVHDLQGNLLAVYEPHFGGAKPQVVVV